MAIKELWVAEKSQHRHTFYSKVKMPVIRFL